MYKIFLCGCFGWAIAASCMEKQAPSTAQGVQYEPVMSRSSSTSSDEGLEGRAQVEIKAVSAAMKKLRDHLRYDIESYETGKQIEALQTQLTLLSERIPPRLLRCALEEHYDQINAITKIQCKLFLELAKKELKSCEDGDSQTKRYLGHAYTNKEKIHRFCAELKDKYGLFAHAMGGQGWGNPLLE